MTFQRTTAMFRTASAFCGLLALGAWIGIAQAQEKAAAQNEKNVAKGVVTKSEGSTVTIKTADGVKTFTLDYKTNCVKDENQTADCKFEQGSVVKLFYVKGAASATMGEKPKAVTVLFQGACKEEFCPKTSCHKKCGAAKCVCTG